MAESTKLNNAKRAAYWNALQRTLSARFPSFVEALRGQTPIQQRQGRTAIVKFRESEKACVERINSHDELQTRLSDSLETNGSVQRHLFIIEDLGRANVEILGSRLGVPPLFFANHWDQPDSKTPMVDGSTLTNNRRKSFKLVFPVLYGFVSKKRKAKFSSGQYIDSKSNVFRGIGVLDMRKEYETCSHQISFWNLNVNSESWIGVLLVDPPIIEARLENISSPYSSLGQLGRSNTPPPLLHVEIVGSKIPGSPLAQLASFSSIERDDPFLEAFEVPVFSTTFDNLLHFYGVLNSPASRDPVSATLVSQRYVLQLWNASLQSRLVIFWRDPKSVNERSSLESSRKTWFEGWDWEWRKEIFHGLTRIKAFGQLMSKDIRYNMQVLGADSRDTFLEESDVEGWTELRAEMASLRERLNDLMEAYIQTSMLQESQSANEQARNIGRLTKVATILLPLTVCTGIFSMSGDFLAGESKFWVFWAFAVPCVSVFTLLAFTHPLRLLDWGLRMLVGLLARLRDMSGKFTVMRNERMDAGLGTSKTKA